MKIKEFFGKLFGRFVMWNLAAMVAVIIVLCFCVKCGLASYTHHGEAVLVPNLTGVELKDAIEQLEKEGLFVVANDTGYVKQMPADAILTQTPGAGTNVKKGRTIYVTINSKSSPMLAIPDLIENSSYREAQARLTAMGFVLTEPKRVEGEGDWVYGIMAGGRSLQTGDRIHSGTMLTLVIGNGEREENSEDAMLDVPEGANDVDEFQEIIEN